jgi:hypothetical protein
LFRKERIIPILLEIFAMSLGTEPGALAGDRVHPTQMGSMVIAKAFLKVCGIDI